MEFGTIDFVQYWSAYQLMISGRNPYDPQLTLAAQCAVGLHCEYPRTTYTPPWLWVVMSPVLMHSFATAAALWSKVSVGLALTSGVVIASIHRLPLLGVLLTAAAAIFSFPFVIDLLFGQLSGLLLLAVSLLYAGLVRDTPPLAAAGLVLLSAKPHLFVPVACAIAVSEMRARRLATASWTAGYLLALAGIAEVYSPGAVRSWLVHILYPATDTGVKAVTFWATDAPAGALARMLGGSASTPARWPLVVFPTLGLAIGLVAGWHTRTGASWQSRYPLLVWAGFVTAPFAWFSDSGVLAFLQVVALAGIVARHATARAVGVFVAGAMLHLGVAILEQSEVPHFALNQMFWFPGALLVLYAIAQDDGWHGLRAIWSGQGSDFDRYTAN